MRGTSPAPIASFLEALVTKAVFPPAYVFGPLIEDQITYFVPAMRNLPKQERKWMRQSYTHSTIICPIQHTLLCSTDSLEQFESSSQLLSVSLQPIPIRM